MVPVANIIGHVPDEFFFVFGPVFELTMVKRIFGEILS